MLTDIIRSRDTPRWHSLITFIDSIGRKASALYDRAMIGARFFFKQPHTALNVPFLLAWNESSRPIFSTCATRVLRGNMVGSELMRSTASRNISSCSSSPSLNRPPNRKKKRKRENREFEPGVRLVKKMQNMMNERNEDERNDFRKIWAQDAKWN